jgi:hypothetical protein
MEFYFKKSSKIVRIVYNMKECLRFFYFHILEYSQIFS